MHTHKFPWLGLLGLMLICGGMAWLAFHGVTSKISADTNYQPASNGVSGGKIVASGVVKAIDRSNPFLRDAGLEKIAVGEIVLNDFTETKDLFWHVVVPMVEGFQKNDRVDLYEIRHQLHLRTLEMSIIIAIRQSPPELNNKKTQ